VKRLEKEHRVLAFRGRFPAIDTLVEQVAGGAKVTKQTKADILGAANTVGLNKYEAEEVLAAVLAAAADFKVSGTARVVRVHGAGREWDGAGSHSRVATTYV
jgi:hypothetical protein